MMTTLWKSKHLNNDFEDDQNKEENEGNDEDWTTIINSKKILRNWNWIRKTITNLMRQSIFMQIANFLIVQATFKSDETLSNQSRNFPFFQINLHNTNWFKLTTNVFHIVLILSQWKTCTEKCKIRFFYLKEPALGLCFQLQRKPGTETDFLYLGSSRINMDLRSFLQYLSFIFYAWLKLIFFLIF